uniref:3'-phosphate/5'-hydroxy nucleic acid ligase n=1 Tax=Entomoneis paludosa TaxID=265537 RepID=A0A6U3ETS2_9STRA|mmetsp:Transcript_8655/g.17982  ORF Transcript_8655/g.17982 Transcript_8655/m.17982 type:complete len:540 (+) Transcript_8655:156-1775(+)
MNLSSSATAAVAAAILLRGGSLFTCSQEGTANAFSIKPINPVSTIKRAASSSARYSYNNNDNEGTEEDDSALLFSAAPELPLIIPTKGVPIHLYTDINEVDPQALQQLRKLAESPLPVDYVSAMPDVHLGKGVTIGSVFASDKYVCPNAVGVDIGCGMAAIPIDGLYKDDLTNDQKNQIQQLLKERIPTGFESYQTPLAGTVKTLDKIVDQVEPTNVLKDILVKSDKAKNQLGTLGGGNHFLEVVYAEDTGQVWIMLHSGSRNIGNTIAQHYNKVAKDLLEKQGVSTHGLEGLNYMPIESQEGQDYLKDMEWCQRYAFENRAAMKKTMLDVVREATGFDQSQDMRNAVNIHHNYCACEECGPDGRKLWVTRKGATSAKLGEMGIIPGSMGTGSYITRGRGNALSWSSSSHGAGRVMSRTAANKNISQKDFEESMKGIVCDTSSSVKDEAPQAYKDLTVVMKNQESLTDIEHRLLPLVNVKGFGKPNKRRIVSPADDELGRLVFFFFSRTHNLLAYGVVLDIPMHRASMQYSFDLRPCLS